MRKIERALREEIDRTNEKVFYFMELTDRLLDENKALTAALVAGTPAAAALRPRNEDAEPKPPIPRPIGL